MEGQGIWPQGKAVKPLGPVFTVFGPGCPLLPSLTHRLPKPIVQKPLCVTICDQPSPFPHHPLCLLAVKSNSPGLLLRVPIPKPFSFFFFDTFAVSLSGSGPDSAIRAALAVNQKGQVRQAGVDSLDSPQGPSSILSLFLLRRKISHVSSSLFPSFSLPCPPKAFAVTLLSSGFPPWILPRIF